MARKNNKGFSVVEIVIAIAILSLLLVPIVTQISQTLKTSRMAKQQQYVTDDAVYLMEDFQKSSMDELELKYGAPAEKPETVECKIYNSSGTDTGKKVKYHAYRYTLSNVKMGPEQKEYSRVVILDDLDTALKGCNDGSNKGFKMAEATTAPGGFTLNSEGHAVKYNADGYVESAVCDTTDLVKNPNDVNLGNMQDMDSSKVAIVPGTSANFDAQAEKAFFSLAMEDLRETNPTTWAQTLGHVDNDSVFNQKYSLDNNIKLTKVYINKENIDGKDYYVVSVDVYYYNSVLDETLSYNVYSQKFNMTECPATYIEYQPYAAESSKTEVIYAANEYFMIDNFVPEAKIYLYKPYSDQMKVTYEDVDTADTSTGETLYKFYTQSTKTNLVKIHLCSLNSYELDEEITEKKEDGTEIKYKKSSSNVYTNISKDNFDTSVISDTLFADVKTDGVSYPDRKSYPGRKEYHGLKYLSEDERFQSRLYTINVTLTPVEDEAGSNAVTFTGAKGEN